MQEQLGVELTVLVEDPQAATLQQILAEAMYQLAQSETVANYPLADGLVQNKHPHIAPSHPLWISPAPFSVKMRIFCLPYAGGVSENVFARCDDVP
jgi:hypothetical protein